MSDTEYALAWGEHFAYPKEYFLQIVKETIYHCSRNDKCFLWFEAPSGMSGHSNFLLRFLFSSEHARILGRGEYLWCLYRCKDLRFLEGIKSKIVNEAKNIGLDKLPSDFAAKAYFYSGKSQAFMHEEDRFIKNWNKEFKFLKIERISIEHVNKRTFKGVFAAYVKRGVDILGSLFCIAIFSWAMIACAVFVKISLARWKAEQRRLGTHEEGDASVIFRQVRVGRNGKLFKCYKFRTMRPGADREKEMLRREIEGQDVERGPTFKMDNDPRILKPGGDFLRRHSLDEFPQFFNVLLGDMSIVGPRPPTPDEVNAYLSWHYARLSVKPGLTCIWQTSGRNSLTFEEWMRLDNKYIRERDTLSDLKLKLKTVEVVISGKGAS